MSKINTNTLVIHACGGAGISTTYRMSPVLAKLGNGYSKLEQYYLDTTDRNVNRLGINSDRALIFKDTGYMGTDVDGSGGERRENFDLINNTITEYMDKRGYDAPSSKEFHIIIFSAGGGSGSIIGPILLKQMLEQDMNVMSIVIGDTSSMSLTRNTFNTLQTLKMLSANLNKPVVIHYKNNTDVPGDTLIDRMKTVDLSILGTLSNYSVFASGRNYNLDNQDIVTFLNYTKLTSMSLPVDLMELRIDKKLIQLKSNDEIVFIARTLGIDGSSVEHGLDDMGHWKHGNIVDTNVIDRIKEYPPLHMYLVHNSLNKIISDLKTKINSNNMVLGALTTNSIVDDDDMLITDDGFVL